MQIQIIILSLLVRGLWWECFEDGLECLSPGIAFGQELAVSIPFSQIRDETLVIPRNSCLSILFIFRQIEEFLLCFLTFRDLISLWSVASSFESRFFIRTDDLDWERSISSKTQRQLFSLHQRNHVGLYFRGLLLSSPECIAAFNRRKLFLPSRMLLRIVYLKMLPNFNIFIDLRKDCRCMARICIRSHGEAFTVVMIWHVSIGSGVLLSAAFSLTLTVHRYVYAVFLWWEAVFYSAFQSFSEIFEFHLWQTRLVRSVFRMITGNRMFLPFEFLFQICLHLLAFLILFVVISCDSWLLIKVLI